MLARALIDGATIPEAAEQCGYPVTYAYAVLESPLLVNAVCKGLARRMVIEGAPAAVALLLRVMKDEEAGWRVRIEAAKTLLDRAGFVAPKAADPEKPGDKGLADMSRDELKGFIAKANNELANRAELIEATPASAPVTGQDADMFE